MCWTCMCAVVPTLAPKDRDRCAFFPLGCTSLGFWMLKDFDAAMITSAARSMPTVGWTDTHTYVRTHVHDHTLQPCMYICVYTTSPIPTHKVQYLHAYTRNSLSLSFQHTLYKCMYCMYVHMYVCMYVHITGIHQGVTWTCQHCSCLCTASSDTMHTYVCVYVTQESWWQYTLNTWCDERMDAMLLNVSASQVKWNILAIIFSLSDVLKLSLSPSTCSDSATTSSTISG